MSFEAAERLASCFAFVLFAFEVGACGRVYRAPARSPTVCSWGLAEGAVTVLCVEEVEIRRSPRARRWRLEVPWGEPARLTVPRSMSRVEVERVLREKWTWIEEQRRRQAPRLGLEGLNCLPSNRPCDAHTLDDQVTPMPLACRVAVSHAPREPQSA